MGRVYRPALPHYPVGMDTPTSFRLWLAGIRPRTLTIAVAPLPPAVALAARDGGHVAVPVVVVAVVAAVAIQAGTNLWNDMADGVAGGDRAGRQGPPRLIAMGWASPARVRRAALACFAIATLCGLYLATIGGWPIVALGLASLLAGWAYSCGPQPLSHIPLGELFVVAFFGIGAVAGMVWLLAGRVGPDALLLGAALGLPAAAVLHVNNTRDMVDDRAAGRRTLAIRLGRGGATWAYGAMMLAPFALLPPVAGAWPGLLAAPEAVRLVYAFATNPPGSRFNALLGATARCQLAMALLAAAGMVLS